jgi:hypothetical protein
MTLQEVPLLNPKPKTPNLESQTLDPNSQIPNPKQVLPVIFEGNVTLPASVLELDSSTNEKFSRHLVVPSVSFAHNRSDVGIPGCTVYGSGIRVWGSVSFAHNRSDVGIPGFRI